jgi:hypothetical protein
MTQPAGASAPAGNKRPGGLTALAVLNFVFGGLSVIGLIALFGMVALVSSAVSAAGGDAPGAGTIYAAIALSGLGTLLLILSGIGYLGQKKMLGRTMGTAYGVVSIASTVISLVMLHSGFGFGTIIGLVYPLLTLFLINVTYKDNLVN